MKKRNKNKTIIDLDLKDISIEIIKLLSKERRIQLFCLFISMGILGLLEYTGIMILSPTITGNNTFFNDSEIFNYLTSNFPNLLKLNKQFFYALFLIIITSFNFILRSFTIFFLVRLSAKVTNDLAYLSYKNILTLPFEKNSNLNSSQIVNLLTFDADRTGDLIGNLLQIFTSISISIAIFIGIFSTNWQFSIISLILINLFYVTYNKAIKNKLAEDGQFITDNNSKQIKIINESIGSIRNIILENSYLIHFKKFRNINRSIKLVGANIEFLKRLPRFLIETIGIIVIALFIIILSFNSVEIINILSYLAVLAYAYQKLVPNINSIYNSLNDIRYAKPCILKVLENIKMQKFSTRNFSKNIIIKPLKFMQSIVLENIKYSYSNNDPIIENLNITILKGDSIGIIGKTGEGKTTFLDLLMGFLNPNKGIIKIDNQAINHNNINSWRQNIAHVPQSIYLLDSTVLENIAFEDGLKNVNLKLAKKVAKIACLGDLSNLNKNGLYKDIGERGNKLSGGQKQRIAIARALYKKKNILILDEATSALDKYTEEQIIKNIKSFFPNLTLIMVAHNHSSLKLCNKIYELSNKKILFKGNYKKLIN